MKDVLSVLLQTQQGGHGGDQKEEVVVIEALKRIPTPSQINESLAQSTRTLLFPAVHVNERSSSINAQHFEFADLFRDQKYIIGIIKGRKIIVHLFLGATLEDELIAYLHGIIVHSMLKDGNINNNNNHHRDLMKRYVVCGLRRTLFLCVGGGKMNPCKESDTETFP